MKKLSVAIPTYNGIDYIDNLLNALDNQKDIELEILIIDSSSTDGTWERVKKHSQVKAWQIPKNEFSHGKTRQILAEKATHEIIVFLSQDAEPIGEYWAADLCGLTSRYPLNVGAFLGNQIPRPDAAPAIAQRINRTFTGLGNDYATTIYEAKNPTLLRKFEKQPLQFLSDVHVAYRRNIILNQVPFANVSYAEDQIMAANLLSNGFDIIYAGYIQAWHSNKISGRNYAKRVYEEILGLNEAINFHYKFRLRREVFSFFQNIAFDFKYLVQRGRGNKSSILKRIATLFGIFLYEFESVRGSWLASRNVLSGASSRSK